MIIAAIVVDQIWKKFRRGELHDSLRDFIPAIAKRLTGRGPKRSDLGKDDFWALRDVSFELRRGEALGVIGPNGAGKSTLLKVLSRILRPNRGRYHVNGRLRALLEVGAGFHNDLTGRENIYLNGSILGMKKREIRAKLEAMIDFSGIEKSIDTPVKRYSSGMRARLGFAVMIHMDPEILLVDEVLAVGDAAFRNKCVTHMRNLIRSEASVVFVSHHLDQVRQLCDRCLVLDAGEARFLGDVDTACDEYLATFRERSPQQSNGANGGGAQLTGLTIYNEHGVETHEVDAHRPLTLEIAYELSQDFAALGIGVNIRRGGGRRFANCNSIIDEQRLASDRGRHRVCLHLDGLPVYSGEYFIGLRLLNVRDATTLDLHDMRYPLHINGSEHGNHLVHLEHRWTPGPACPSAGRST